MAKQPNKDGLLLKEAEEACAKQPTTLCPEEEEGEEGEGEESGGEEGEEGEEGE